MALSFTVKDAHTVMTLMGRMATGNEALTVTDATGFVSTGTTIKSMGTETVFNVISTVMNRLIVASRAYRRNLYLMDAEDNGVFSALMRKISFYSDDPMPTGASNTDLYTNFAEGFTAGQNGTDPVTGNPVSTKSQWEQHRKVPFEMHFCSQAEWQYGITFDEDKIEIAFRNEEEFGRYMAGYIQEHANDIETTHEAWNRLALLNKVASIYAMASDMNGAAIDLVAAYNSKYGTSYTGTQLRTTYRKEFLGFFVATVRQVSDYMAERNKLYHWSADKTINGVTQSILRHTPYDRQRFYLYDRFFIDAESEVLPEIFHDDRLDIKKQYQPVTFWQSITSATAGDARAQINFKPVITNTSTGAEETAANAVVLPYVLGLICDTDALMTIFELDRVDTTAVEARKHYRNTWNTFRRGAITDPTEKAVLLYMAS